MKKRVIVGIITALCSFTALAEDAVIANIRKIYEDIQKESNSFKTSNIELDVNYATEGGELKSYRDAQGKLRVLRAELYYESGKSFKNFYYQDDHLVFAFYKNYQYNSPIYVNKNNAKEMAIEPFDEKKSVLTEERYYLDQGHLIRYVKDKETINTNRPEFKSAEQDVLNTEKQMQEKLKP